MTNGREHAQKQIHIQVGEEVQKVGKNIGKGNSKSTISPVAAQTWKNYFDKMLMKPEKN